MARLISDEVDANAMVDLIYDYAVDKLSFQWVDHDLSLKKNSFSNHPCDLLTPYISYQWNSHLRQLHVYNTANGTSRMHPLQRDCHEVTGGKKVVVGDKVLFLIAFISGPSIRTSSPTLGGNLYFFFQWRKAVEYYK